VIIENGATYTGIVAKIFWLYACATFTLYVGKFTSILRALI
jgi:hypothetical protein